MKLSEINVSERGRGEEVRGPRPNDDQESEDLRGRQSSGHDQFVPTGFQRPRKTVDRPAVDVRLSRRRHKLFGIIQYIKKTLWSN